MPDFGAYSFYIIGAYGFSTAGLLVFILACLRDAKAAAKALALERKE